MKKPKPPQPGQSRLRERERERESGWVRWWSWVTYQLNFFFLACVARRTTGAKFAGSAATAAAKLKKGAGAEAFDHTSSFVYSRKG